MSSIAELKDDNGAVIYPKTLWEAVDGRPLDTGWKNMTMASGAEGSSSDVPQYRRIGNLVYLTGQVTTHGIVGPIATLPVGYRPALDVHRDPSVASSTRTETVRVYVSTAGVVSVISAYHDFGIWLDIFCFLTDEPFPLN